MDSGITGEAAEETGGAAFGRLKAEIFGVSLVPLKMIPTQGGPVLHMLKADSPHFAGFGEIYFSEVEPGQIKGWKRHLRMSQNFAVPCGQVKFVLYDGRQNSPTGGMIQEYVLGRPDNYFLLSLPPLVWYSFACLSEEPVLIANLTDIMHDPAESETAPLCREAPPQGELRAKSALRGEPCGCGDAGVSIPYVWAL